MKTDMKKETSLIENSNKKVEGDYLNGKRTGCWIYYYATGEVEHEVPFVDEEEHGILTSWYKNGQKLQETQWKNGKRNGCSTLWFDDGQIEEQGSYEDDERVGTWVEWFNPKEDEICGEVPYH